MLSSTWVQVKRFGFSEFLRNADIISEPRQIGPGCCCITSRATRPF